MTLFLVLFSDQLTIYPAIRTNSCIYIYYTSICYVFINTACPQQEQLYMSYNEWSKVSPLWLVAIAKWIVLM